jgi:hypothetical protein
MEFSLVLGQLHVPVALPSWKEPLTPIGLGARAGLGDVEKRNFLTIQGPEPDFSVVQLVANCYTDYAIPAQGKALLVTVRGCP